MGEDGSERRTRLGESLLVAIFVIIVALFVYSMLDAYVLSLGERPSANPFGGRA